MRRLFRLVVRPPAVEQEVNAEISFHLEEEARARMALGDAPDVAVVGIVLGAAVSLAAGRFLASLLFGVSASDPGTFILVAVVLLGVAGLASVIPAWRAARADPTSALGADS